MHWGYWGSHVIHAPACRCCSRPQRLPGWRAWAAPGQRPASSATPMWDLTVLLPFLAFVPTSGSNPRLRHYLLGLTQSHGRGTGACFPAPTSAGPALRLGRGAPRTAPRAHAFASPPSQTPRPHLAHPPSPPTPGGTRPLSPPCPHASLCRRPGGLHAERVNEGSMSRGRSA